ncbi:MAG: ABC transporter ATP-binding protein [Bacteroidia bacterium]|nr:ABC transporter ATP-binding protein [Bacteroidia bacterium]
MKSIQVNNIGKSYHQIPALKDISFGVEKGELFGLIGPDGAGKTTLLRILTTLLIADKGTATIEGSDVVKDYKTIRRIVGYMPGRFSLYQDLSVEENLKFFAAIFGATIEENYHLIKNIYSQIEPFKTRKAGKLSGGMKQKLALSCVMIHKPAVLFLDEPTTGVDAVSRTEFWEMLRDLKNSGITILVSTPYMDEARLCDRVALMQNGKIMNIDKPQRIIENFSRRLCAIKTKNMYRLLKDLQGFQKTNTVYPFGEFLHYTAKENDIDMKEIIKYLEQKDHEGIEMREITANIEDCFMELMNKN